MSGFHRSVIAWSMVGPAAFNALWKMHIQMQRFILKCAWMRLAAVCSYIGYFMIHFRICVVTLSSCGQSAISPIKTCGTNGPNPQGGKSKQTPGFHFQVKRGCESLNLISPFRCLLCLHCVSSCIPLGKLGNGNNVKTCYVFSGPGEKGTCLQCPRKTNTAPWVFARKS